MTKNYGKDEDIYESKIISHLINREWDDRIKKKFF